MDMSLYPDLTAQSHASFEGLLEGLKPFMPDASEKQLMIRAVNIWASVPGLVGIIRNANSQDNKTESLAWIEGNLEAYLEATTFG